MKELEKSELDFLKMTPIIGAKDMPKARYELLSLSLKEASAIGLHVEFGVATGATINYIASQIPNKKIYGFDWFQGLPEKWWGCPVGHFKQDILPKVAKNVELIVGKFEDTLDPFKKDHPEVISFAHIDCDLYSSTKTIFEKFANKFITGTVIQFDEFYNYPSYEDHEIKAFLEFVQEHGFNYKYLGRTEFYQVAVKLL